MVFYRKYRPQTLDELDSAAVRQKLNAVLKNPDNIPHAFLFTGPKGLGKTSTARIIAKVVNCTADKKQRGTTGIEPCNICVSCVAITNGSNMDILEIDAASNRGIDEIRDVKETIKLAPLSARKKVYIIDEVHMLTTEAFNALLKTLEEPPAHALFMLCTTEPQKVPPTILSRTFHINFQKATIEELTRAFKRITTAEKITVTDDALIKIAELSDGGFRDGTKLLEEVTALAGGQKITVALLDETYHVTDTATYRDAIIHALSVRDVSAALQQIAQLTHEGVNIRYVLEGLLMSLHGELLRISGVDIPGQLPESAEEFTIADLKKLLSLLQKAIVDMRSAVIPQLSLEIAIIEWCVPEEKQIITVSTPSDGGAVITQVGNEEVSVTTLRRHIGNVQKNKALYGEEKMVVEKKIQGPPANVSVFDFSAEGEITPEWLQELWTCIIRDIKQHNHTLAGVLRGCKLKSFDRKMLVIEAAYEFHRKKLDNGETKDVLEQIAKALTGNPVSVTIELKTA